MAEGAGQRVRSAGRSAGLAPQLSRRRERRQGASLALPITPMIDVIFLLLLYFMLAGRFRAAEGAIAARLEPVETQARVEAFALPEIPAIVRVARVVEDAGAGVGARIDAPEPIDLLGADVAALEARARELLASGGLGAAQRVIVRAGASARWQDAIDAIAALSRAGLTRVALESAEAP